MHKKRDDFHMVSLLVLLAYLQVENKPASGLTFKTPNTQGTKRAIDSLKVSLRFTRDGISDDFFKPLIRLETSIGLPAMSMHTKS